METKQQRDLKALVKQHHKLTHALGELHRALEKLGESINNPAPPLTSNNRREASPIEEEVTVAKIKYSDGEKKSTDTRENQSNKGSEDEHK